MSISSIDEQRCTYHPDIRTRLRCSKCETPICPRCAVDTPVGYRCPECAGVRGLPTYETSTPILLKSVGIGIVVASAVGVLWGFFPQWQFYLALLIGFGVAESMSWAANYKRGPDLQFAAIGCVLIGIAISRITIANQSPFYDLEHLFNNALDPRVAATFQIRLIPDLLFVALAGAIPFIRFR
jgi:hypothetical protein